MRLLTPKGIELYLELEEIMRKKSEVSCAVRKYSGDDPDVTNGILVYATVQKVEKKNGGESSGYIDGLRSPFKKDGGVMSTPIDGWEEHRMFIGGAIVFDPTTCGVYSPQID